jgi:NADH-quinone oxidoreductase subunit M
MILLSLILILLIGGILSWIVSRWDAIAARWIAVASVGADFAVTVAVLLTRGVVSQAGSGRWFVESNVAWIPQFGIRLH